MTTIDTYAAFTAKPTSTRSKRTELDSFGLRGRVVIGSIFAFLLVVGLGGWSATAKLSGAVISVGTVLVDDEVKAIQHLDGGVVRAIEVREGDIIDKDAVLLRLDDVQIGTERSILVGQMAELVAKQARLQAQARQERAIAFPAGYLADYPDAGPILIGEQQLFDSTKLNQQSLRSQLLLQVAQLNEEIAGLDYQSAALEEELTLAQVERARMGELAGKGLIETTKLNSADRELARMMGSEGEIAASIARAQARISEIELQILAIDQTGGMEALRELRTVDARLAELRDRLTEVDARQARTVIRSPVSGTVNEVAVTTLGGVITPAERLMTIVPADADLKIEFRVAINDIDQLRLNQPVKLRFSAFNQRTTPEIAGVVTRISAAATTDPQSGQSFYLAEADPTDDLEQLGPTGLVPGMPVEVFVQTEEQLAIAYFVRPFTDQISRAFREE